MNHTSVNPDTIVKPVPSRIMQLPVLDHTITLGSEVQCFTTSWPSANLPPYPFKKSLYFFLTKKAKKHVKKLTHYHCTFYVWRIFWTSWPALVLLPFLVGCVGEPCCLNSSSQPSGHAHQYLTHYKSRGLGISVGDRVAQDSWPLPPASAVLCTTGYSHSTRDKSSGGRYQKQLWHRRKRWGISIQNNEKDKKLNRERGQKGIWKSNCLEWVSL